MMYFTTIPRPRPGDVFTRYRDSGEYEVAMVLCVQTRAGDDWTATVACANGWEFITGAPERRGFEAWFPHGWIFDTGTQTFRPPNTRWDDEKHEFVPADLSEPAPVSIPRPGDPTGATLLPETDRPIPGLTDIPRPSDGEHHLAWRARVKRANPSANFADPRVVAAMKAQWEAHRGAMGPTPDGEPNGTARP
ncbi:MAG: hypothetical protein QME96_06880 [Myxococcota bacterium]|nr:hypothetical protein [Myxococcota bacterium]